jgi:DNA-binding MarR family transcriptional regulator
VLISSFTTAKKLKMKSDVPLMWLFWETFQYTRRSFDEALRPHGISGTQLSVLNRIAQRPGLSGVELARLMLTTPQAAQLTLSTLERKGLVERKPDIGNGHITRSFLTRKGCRLVDLCRAEVHDVEKRLLGVLSPTEQEALSELLSSYLQQLPETGR